MICRLSKEVVKTGLYWANSDTHSGTPLEFGRNESMLDARVGNWRTEGPNCRLQSEQPVNFALGKWLVVTRGSDHQPRGQLDLGQRVIVA